MTLTHEQIAEMTREEVNIAIAKRRDEIFMTGIDVETAQVSYPDYCHEWYHAGRLLEMMTDEASGLPDLEFIANHWICCGYNGGEHVEVVCQTAQTAQEAIARCWLEWSEVTHE